MNPLDTPREAQSYGPWIPAVRRTAGLCGMAAVALGACVLAGWIFDVTALIQIRPSFSAMQFNTALGFVLAGTALWAVVGQHRRTGAILAVATSGLGAATLVEYVAGVDLGIDQLLMVQDVPADNPNPGRMGPNTALCFTLSGLALLALAQGPSSRARLVASSLMGTVTVALGLLALLGYLGGIRAAFGWGEMRLMALHTSVGFVVLSIGIVGLAWTYGTQGIGAYRWFPALASVIALTATVYFWQSVVAEARHQLDRDLARTAARAASGLRWLHDARLGAIERMARRGRAVGPADHRAWEADARAYLDVFPDLRTIALVDARLPRPWGVSRAGGAGDLEDAVELVAGHPGGLGTAFVVPITGADGDAHVQLAAPIVVAGMQSGAVVAISDASTLIERELLPLLGVRRALSIEAGGVRLFDGRSSADDPAWRDKSASFEFMGIPWTVQAIASPDDVPDSQRALATIVAVTGVAVSILLFVALASAQAAGLRAVSVVRVNRNLQEEIKRRARTEDALRKTESLVRSIVDNTAAVIFVKDLEGRYLLVNRQFERIFGVEPDKVIGGTDYDLFDPALCDAYRTNDLRVVETGEPLEVEEVARHPDGKRDYLSTRFPLFDAAGRIYAVGGVSTDVTTLKAAQRVIERSRDELEAQVRERTATLAEANEELRRRNASLDEFTYMASHDLQEPVRKLVSFSRLLAEDLGGDLPEAAAKDVEFITSAALRMQKLIQDLLALSRADRGEIRMEEVALDECVDDALEALSVPIQESGAKIARVPLPVVLGGRVQLTQLYQNLLGNAVKFRKGPPEIRLTADRNDGEWVLGVQDNGIGLDPRYAEQIFAPFKRLHKSTAFEGTGIGLAICKRTVERHGGRIWVETSVDAGAHFKFTLAPNTKGT